MLERLITELESDPNLVDFAKRNIHQTLNVEFMGQIQPVMKDVTILHISVEDSGKTVFYLDIASNKFINGDGPVYFDSAIKRAFFIDNPFSIDLGAFFYRSDLHSSVNGYLDADRIAPHEVKLNNYLRREDVCIFESGILERCFSSINAKINEIVEGDFKFTEDGDFYVENGKRLRFLNLATGSKVFSILKLLLNKGALDESTVLVLDEPESHLHPDWQNKFAEVIVMLVKALDVKILLTSHSPNFVLAIDVFMCKYEINDRMNFYQTHVGDNGFSEYVKFNDDMGLIYSDFVQYLTEVKLLRDRLVHGLGEHDD